MSKGTFFTTKTKNNTQIVTPPPSQTNLPHLRKGLGADARRLDDFLEALLELGLLLLVESEPQARAQVPVRAVQLALDGRVLLDQRAHHLGHRRRLATTRRTRRTAATPGTAAAAAAAASRLAVVDLREVVEHGTLVAVELVGHEGGAHDLAPVASGQVAQHERLVHHELRRGRRHGPRHHHPQAGHVHHVLRPRHAQRGRVRHVAAHVHAAAPRPPRHLPELVGAEPAVPRAQVVGLVELREHHGPRGHVHPHRQRLRREDHFDQPRLEAQLDELAQHRQHACVVVRDAPLEQVHDVVVRLQLAELGHEPKQVTLHERLLRVRACARDVLPFLLLLKLNALNG